MKKSLALITAALLVGLTACSGNQASSSAAPSSAPASSTPSSSAVSQVDSSSTADTGTTNRLPVQPEDIPTMLDINWQMLPPNNSPEGEFTIEELYEFYQGDGGVPIFIFNFFQPFDADTPEIYLIHTMMDSDGDFRYCGPYKSLGGGQYISDMTRLVHAEETAEYPNIQCSFIVERDPELPNSLFVTITSVETTDENQPFSSLVGTTYEYRNDLFGEEMN